jgi:large subunit ribosomal protein L23
MDLSIYDVIQGPVVTDKAYRLNQNLKKLVLRVHPHANKPMVAEALEKLFDVKVDNVRIIVRKGKFRKTRRGREMTQGPTVKKAIVTLAAGHNLDLFDQAGKVSALAEKETKAE